LRPPGVSGSPGGDKDEAGAQTGVPASKKISLARGERNVSPGCFASVIEPASKACSAAFFTCWLPAFATGAACFMIVLDTSIVNLALARIGSELNSGLATLQWLVDAYALVFPR
jgi:hypothetical protein